MPTLSRSIRVGYSLGSVATGTFGTVPGLLLLPYLTDTLGVTAAVAGVIVFLPKACDVVLNPIAGRISDRHRSPRGPRRPFLLGGGSALAVCFALLFAGPALGSVTANAFWVVAAFLACAPAYAFFQVPYVAMPAEITDDYGERTSLMSWRVVILALAILLSGASAPAIRDAVGGQNGYRVMGLAVAGLLLLGTVGSYVGTRRAPLGRITATAGTWRDQFRVVAAASDFRALLATFLIQALAIGAMLAGVDYMARYILGQAGAASLLFACFVGPALLVTPLWRRFGDHWGKKSGYVAATILLACGALLLCTARVTPNALVFCAGALAGVGYAGAQVFPLAMLADTAAVDAARTGNTRVGVFTGIWTAVETLGLALGPAVYAAVLSVGGYVSSMQGTSGQPESALNAIVVGFSAVPGVLIVLSLLVLRGYRLTRAQVKSAMEGR